MSYRLAPRHRDHTRNVCRLALIREPYKGLIPLPITIPAFDQYQAALIPLRGLWNTPPKEGDRYVNAEIDWLVTTKSTAVQFSLSGNSPVSLSQIVSVYVDNARNGADLELIFPDSGFALTVVARSQGLFPVLTNALMFYASCPGAIPGDISILQILNSQGPAIPITASLAQNQSSVAGFAIVNGSTQIVPASISGTLNAIAINITATGAASAGTANLTLYSGSGKILWQTVINIPANANETFPIDLNGLAVRFQGGITMLIQGATNVSGQILANVYYTTP